MVQESMKLWQAQAYVHLRISILSSSLKFSEAYCLPGAGKEPRANAPRLNRSLGITLQYLPPIICKRQKACCYRVGHMQAEAPVAFTMNGLQGLTYLVQKNTHAGIQKKIFSLESNCRCYAERVPTGLEVMRAVQRCLTCHGRRYAYSHHSHAGTQHWTGT